jgi:hypothetical protein
VDSNTRERAMDQRQTYVTTFLHLYSSALELLYSREWEKYSMASDCLDTTLHEELMGTF